MRLDVAGLGDSTADDDSRENNPYPPTIFRDVASALRQAQNGLGAKRVVLMGLCSGAYVAFQSAVQFSDPAFVECVLINPLTYFWTEGMSLEMPSSRQRAEELEKFHYYTSAALRPSKWLKLLVGQTRIGWVGAIKELAHHWRRPAQPKSSNSIDRPYDAAVTHPEQNDLPGDLDRAVGAGRNIACFFGRNESGYNTGYSLLMHHAGRKARAFRRSGKLNLFFLDQADHTFSSRNLRLNLFREIAEYLCKRYR
jgi:hypothetical protein